MKREILRTIIRQGAGTLGRRVTKDEILATLSKSGRSGALGGVLDGFLGAAEAVKLHRLGYIDTQTAARHASNEAACGFFTATAGTLGTSVAALVVGSITPTALVVGMGASVGARWFYRKNSESYLPDLNEELPLNEEDEKDLENLLSLLGKKGVEVPKQEDPEA